MENNCSVQIEHFANNHFIKNFKKKYRSSWDVTLEAIKATLVRIDNFLNTDKAEVIIDREDVKIIKAEFKIAGTEVSAKSSGNRYIVAWHKYDNVVFVLLVYGKTDISSKNNETAEWKNIIKTNYSKYKELF